MHDHMHHLRDSASGRAAGTIGEAVDLPAAMTQFRHEFADAFPAQLTDADHAELQSLLVTLERLIGDT
jgi:hypothetical protein